MGLFAARLREGSGSVSSARRVRLLIPVGIVLAVATGALMVAAPMPTFAGVVASAVVVLMLAIGRRSAAVFLVALGTLLMAYAMAGRGIAYVGGGGLYIGEFVLFLGIIAFVLNIHRARFGLVHWLILAFMGVGLVRTVPFIGTYGVLALRDGVVWGYAAFALFVSTTFQPTWFDRLIHAYRLLIPALLAWLPVATALALSYGDRLPGWPGSPVPIIVIKQGDFAVHLAGIAAFVLVGLYASRRGSMPSWIVWALFFLDLAIVATVSRGGLVAIALGAGSALLFLRSGQRLFTAAGIALAGFLLLFALNPVVNVGSNQGRELSFNQLVENVVSVVTASDSGNLQGTKEWRLAWWNKIVGYTIDGPYFWTGKGFGINLADSDGFVLDAAHSLRSPHNGHLAMLARGGVPLLAAWALIQVSFGIGLLRAARRARTSGRTLLVQLAGWVFAIWVAALVNMSFDVYLEGPQGGIWFWSMIGLGLVVMRVANESPADPAELGAATQPGDWRRAIPPPAVDA